MMSKEQNIAVQPKIALDDLLTRCTDYDDMSLSMDAGELKALKQHISLLESSASTELLSLREQLAELKALPPFSWGLADKDGNAYLSECCIGDEGCMIDEAEAYNYELEPEHHIHAVPLFTASKPAED
ncbi:hypothetical protein ACLIXB_004276 [Yersinia enterocolitica]|uniref:hypothetical protein n=1 Tax=Yersinia enterocolitica TaxID=630 RepID=UPI0038773BB7